MLTPPSWTNLPHPFSKLSASLNGHRLKHTLGKAHFRRKNAKSSFGSSNWNAAANSFVIFDDAHPDKGDKVTSPHPFHQMGSDETLKRFNSRWFVSSSKHTCNPDRNRHSDTRCFVSLRSFLFGSARWSISGKSSAVSRYVSTVQRNG